MTSREKSASSFWRLIKLAAFATLLSACGGGGGGSGSGGQTVTFSLSTTHVAFSAVTNGSAPPVQNVTVTAIGGPVYFSMQSSGSALDNAAISCSGTSSCQISLSPISPKGLAPGNYTEQLVVTGCTAQAGCGSQVSGSPQTIDVSYAISAGATLSSAPKGVGIVTSADTSAPAQTISLTSTDTSATPWTSSVTYVAGGASGWLTVPGSGSAPGGVQLGVGALPLGSYRAVVTFTPTGGGTAASLLVVAVSHSAGVRYVAPYVAVSGLPGSVILRGSGFAALAPAQTQVLVGGSAATNVQVLSDSEITATSPALPAGRYAIQVKDSTQALAGSPALVVVDPPAYAYAKIPRVANSDPVQPQHLLFDAERGALYLYDVNSFGAALGGQYADQIERYRFSAGSWSSDVLVAFTPLGQVQFNARGQIMLTPDGAELSRIGATTVDQLDPAAGTLLATTDAGDTFAAASGQTSLWTGAMTNEGFLLGNAHNNSGFGQAPGFAYFYDVQTRAYLPAPQAPTGSADLFQFDFSATADGGGALLTEGFNTPVPIVLYDSATRSYPVSGGLGTLISSLVSLSRNGARAVMHADATRYAVVDFAANQTNLVGYLPAPDPDAVVLSPDGTRAYTFDATANVVHAYDLTAAVDADAQFPEIGSGVTLVDRPSATGSNVQMIITPDGGTLVLAGTTNVIVTPKPAG